MGKYILGTLIILIFGFIISKILIDLGRNEDEMGIYILEKALSKTMLQIIGLLFLGVLSEIIGDLLNIAFFQEKSSLWALLVVSIGLVAMNTLFEKRKLGFKNEK
ncbi:hypothetical protein [Vagococcus salmoninarum]|uniref:hypothetical protein n=1 Tax=Vagococcus salmoninarum TaxID=2739 RepID=UPI003F9E4852